VSSQTTDDGSGGTYDRGRGGNDRGMRRPPGVLRPAILTATLALAVRLLYLWQTKDVPFVCHLVGDAAGYYQWARQIAGGSWLGSDTFYQAPLYPYALAIWFRWVSDAVWTVRLLQAVWGSIAVGCLCIATGVWFGRAVGIMAGVMLALYGPAVFFDGIIQKASMDGLLVCAMLALMSAAVADGVVAMEHGAGAKRRTDVSRLCLRGAIGVVGGLLCLTRENAIVWLPIVGVWIGSISFRAEPASASASATTWPRWMNPVVAYVVGIVAVLVPVGVRNVVVGGEWSISTFQAGPNFYIGNHAGADGRYRPLVRGHETPAFERADATKLAEEALGRKLSARDVSSYWMGRAIADIRADLPAWLKLVARKLLMTWNRYEVSDVESPLVYRDSSSVLAVLGFWHFGVLSPLAAIGAVATWQRRRGLWIWHALIVSMAVSVAAFYILARYRFPLVSLLIPFAAAGCVSIWHHLREIRRRWVAHRFGGSRVAHRFSGGGLERNDRMPWPQVVAGLVAAVIVNWPMHDERRLDSMAVANLGVALGAEGDLPGAVRYFELALEGHPHSAETHFNLAYALSLQQRQTEAIDHYEAALRLEPDLIHADLLLAESLERVGRVQEAIVHYARAVELDPANNEARAALARLSGQSP